MSDTNLTLLANYIPYMKYHLNLIMEKLDSSPAGNYIKAISKIIGEALNTKDAATIVADHDTNFAFVTNMHPCTASLAQSWWKAGETKPQLFVLAMLTFGPADGLSPPHSKRVNQGILCQPHVENNRMTPIELLGSTISDEFYRVGKQHKMGAEEIMHGYVENFTSLQHVKNDTIDNLQIIFVKGSSQLEPVKGNRLDIVYSLHVVYYTGMLVYLANPKDFQHYHPLILITNIFLAQKNFFPPDKDVEKALSKSEKNNYLLALGVHIFDAIRKEFETKFFLDNEKCFPSKINPTMMPAPKEHILYLGAPGAPVAMPPVAAFAAADAETVQTYFFLFGKQTEENDKTQENGIKAEPLDDSIFPFYESVLNSVVDDDFSQVSLGEIKCRQLKILITIVCPKEDLKLEKKKNFGLANKAIMIALLQKRISSFNSANLDYITKLKEAIPDEAE